ncbi:hypothetical protein GGR58DRAFT_502306 [Xylaria digitata]|nr:hypothetical protein GGR58DRAFT_502306 [Xylaria digitata]
MRQDPRKSVTLVLDALDEINEDSRQELLDALSDLVRQSISLARLFISSRSNYDIELHLAGTPNIYIRAEDNAEDTYSFIDKKLTEARLLHGNMSPSLHDDIVKTLERGARGMFRARLGTLPATLEASYWDILEQIRNSGNHALRLATFTFQWLLYAGWPMSLDGFAALASIALATENTTKFTGAEVLDVCSNLIVERPGVFEFAHLSVREFLERLENRQIDTYKPEQGNAALAQACLRY